MRCLIYGRKFTCIQSSADKDMSDPWTVPSCLYLDGDIGDILLPQVTKDFTNFKFTVRLITWRTNFCPRMHACSFPARDSLEDRWFKQSWPDVTWRILLTHHWVIHIFISDIIPLWSINKDPFFQSITFSHWIGFKLNLTFNRWTDDLK